VRDVFHDVVVHPFGRNVRDKPQVPPKRAATITGQETEHLNVEPRRGTVCVHQGTEAPQTHQC
jgi:hypothetical protein